MTDDAPRPLAERPWVAHSVIVWLPMGENWIWTQVADHRRFRPLVLTKRVENLDAFPLDDVGGELVAAYANPWRRVWAKAARSVGAPYPAWRRAIGRHRPVLLHTHFGQAGFDNLALRRRTGVPHVVSVYGADIWRWGRREDWRPRYRRMFQEVDTFVAEGSAMKRRMVELGCPERKVRVSHLGVDLHRIPFRPRQPGDGGEVRCLMAGRAIEKKGMIHGLRAFIRVAQTHPELRLTVMTWGDADYKIRLVDGLRRLAEEHEVADRIEWFGLRPYDEYLRIIRDSHVFLVPSVIAENGDAEGGAPVTAIEVSASGMPIVGFAHCDIPEVVRDGVSGFLAPERDDDGLADRLAYVVERPGDWLEMGRAGRAWIEAEYNAATSGTRLEAIYDDVLAGTTTESEHDDAT
ncbi:MAG: hypothetical protein CMJ83_09300 [Planctomycetes bacterium]|nr:hypothetical protein [Planctomycetota bacterium]